jgi:hypothetical protein
VKLKAAAGKKDKNDSTEQGEDNQLGKRQRPGHAGDATAGGKGS